MFIISWFGDVTDVAQDLLVPPHPVSYVLRTSDAVPTRDVQEDRGRWLCATTMVKLEHLRLHPTQEQSRERDSSQ